MMSRCAAFVLLVAMARPAAAGPCDADVAQYCRAASEQDQGVNRCLEKRIRVIQRQKAKAEAKAKAKAKPVGD